MIKKDDRIKKIKAYYDRILSLIEQEDLKGANKILFNEMPVGLYDYSLTILDNPSVSKEEAKIKSLIKKVDTKLNPEIDEEFESELNDEFNNLF